MGGKEASSELVGSEEVDRKEVGWEKVGSDSDRVGREEGGMQQRCGTPGRGQEITQERPCGRKDWAVWKDTGKGKAGND